MAGSVKAAFESRTQILSVSSLMPLKTVPPTIKQSTKYRVIAKSVLEIGIIEPLVVARSKEEAGRYLLLDPRWTVENRQFVDRAKPAISRVAETSEFYFVPSSVRKSVCTFVRQLRGPHLRTWA